MFIKFFPVEESADTNGQVASSTTSESEDFLRKYGFEFPAKESRTEGNSGADHVLIQSVNETVSKSGELSDQPGEIIYDSPKGISIIWIIDIWVLVNWNETDYGLTRRFVKFNDFS